MMGEANALAQAVDIPNAGKMVDAGCGSGIYSLMLCRHNPKLNALLLDRKEVLETTRKFIEKSNFQNRMTTREADIFTDSFGNGLDVVLLSDVLYQEDYLCIAILRSAYAALAPGGMLVVRGYYVDSDNDGPHSAFAPLFNIHQLFDDPKREVISVSLLSQWAAQVGFKIIKTFPLTERSHCLIAQRLLTI
jgi:SAM-dependent methyltransferase